MNNGENSDNEGFLNFAVFVTHDLFKGILSYLIWKLCSRGVFWVQSVNGNRCGHIYT